MTQTLGIDLGTTNCCAAVSDHGEIRVLKLGMRETLPSVLAQLKDGSMIVGSHARNKKNAQFRYAFVKREMGSDTTFELLGGPVKASDISAEFLKVIKKTAQEQLQTSVNGVVLTIPAHFDVRAEKATLEAAEKAGFYNIELFREPVAAAVAYFRQKEVASTEDWQSILVYDLGGGTVDVTVCSRKGDHFEVEANGSAYCGDQFLGGLDFDRALVALAIEQAKKLGHSISMEDDQKRHNYSMLWWNLMLEAERVKHLLSKYGEAEWQQQIEVGPDNEEIELCFYVSRQEYEERIRPIVSRTMTYCDKALVKFGQAWREGQGSTDFDLAQEASKKIDAVILVGGSSRTPLVRDMIKTHFEKKYQTVVKIHIFEPDKCVAIGAAHKAATLRQKTDQRKTEGPHIVWSVLERSSVSGGVERFPASAGRVENCQECGYRIRLVLPDGTDLQIAVQDDGGFSVPEIELQPGVNIIRAELVTADDQIQENLEHVIRRGGLSTGREGLARPFRIRLADAPDEEILPVGMLPGAAHRTTLYVGAHDGSVRLPVYEGYRTIGTVWFETSASPGTPVDISSIYQFGRVQIGVRIGDFPEQTKDLEIEPLHTNRRLMSLEQEFRQIRERTRLLLQHMEEELADAKKTPLNMLSQERDSLIFEVTFELENKDLADLSRVFDRLQRFRELEWKLHVFVETSEFIRAKAEHFKEKLAESGLGLEESEREAWHQRLETILTDSDLERSMDARKVAQVTLEEFEQSLNGAMRSSDIPDAYIEGKIGQLKEKVQAVISSRGSDFKNECNELLQAIENIENLEETNATKAHRLYDLEYHDINPIYIEHVVRRAQQGLLKSKP